MNWLSDFADRIQHDVPLGRLTWYRLGGRAKYMLRPRDARQLAHCLERCKEKGVPARVLGGGANVLIRDDGFDGLVVRLDAPAFRAVGASENDEEVTVGAGVDLLLLVKQLSEWGRTGLEALAGVPGTVGGAIRMNAGGRDGCLGDVVIGARLVDREGAEHEWSHGELGFGYRQSNVGDRVVLAATLRLGRDDPGRCRERFRHYLRMKQRTQPLRDRSAGCVFKNPPGESAGALIDRAGLKGESVGGARVSCRHANFIIADRSATAGDVVRLIERVRDRVAETFGTVLENEVEIW